MSLSFHYLHLLVLQTFIFHSHELSIIIYCNEFIVVVFFIYICL